MIFSEAEIEVAAALLLKGEVVAFPTETVYGLGGSIFIPEAIKKIFLAKGRPADNPLIIHIAALNQVELIAASLPKGFDELAAAFFPGPLTLIVPKKQTVPAIVSANLPTVGIRMPTHPVAQKLICATGPLAAPSANLSGRPSSTTAAHVAHDFKESIAAILDGGSCSYGLESTVLLLEPEPTILRPGAITKEQIEQVLKCGVKVADGHTEKPLSPGMKYRHYAPLAKVILVYSEEELTAYKSPSSKKRFILPYLSSQNLYASLRLADLSFCEEIIILCTQEMKKDAALMNRLSRAANA